MKKYFIPACVLMTGMGLESKEGRMEGLIDWLMDVERPLMKHVSQCLQ